MFLTGVTLIHFVAAMVTGLPWSNVAVGCGGASCQPSAHDQEMHGELRHLLLAHRSADSGRSRWRYRPSHSGNAARLLDDGERARILERRSGSSASRSRPAHSLSLSVVIVAVCAGGRAQVTGVSPPTKKSTLTCWRRPMRSLGLELHDIDAGVARLEFDLSAPPWCSSTLRSTRRFVDASASHISPRPGRSRAPAASKSSCA